jgi:hypothetical protein
LLVTLFDQKTSAELAKARQIMKPCRKKSVVIARKVAETTTMARLHRNQQARSASWQNKHRGKANHE